MRQKLPTFKEYISEELKDKEFRKIYEKEGPKLQKIARLKKKIQYTNESIGDIKIVKNFLPAPDKLVFKRKSVKVTMALDVESVAFFKKIAQHNHVPYQTMIRNLINTYVAKYQVN